MADIATPTTKVLQGIRNTYTIGQRVGSGHNASIAACTARTGVTYCVKIPFFGTITRKVFKQEIIWLRSFAHPSIVQYIDRDEHFNWMAMELAEGNLKEFKPFTLRESEVVTYQVLDALSYIHSFDIIHHDVKLLNILVKTRTEYHILVKLADFGASLHASDELSEHEGTPANWAPECFGRAPEFTPKFGIEMDVWALGITVLKLLDELPEGPYIPDTQPPVPLIGPQSPYAEGWRGIVSAKMAAYRASNAYVPKQFLETLSRMLDLDPRARIGAADACKHLRKGCTSGYFLSLGMEDDDPPAIVHALLADTQGDNESIFKFCQLNIQGLEEPLVMLEGGYIINIQQLLEAKFKPEDDMEVATCKALKELKHPCWRFKRTHHSPETYMRFEDALILCKQTGHLKRFLRPLKEQKVLLDKTAKDEAEAGKKEVKKDAKGKGKAALKKTMGSIKAPSGMRQLDLLKLVSASDYVVAITEGNRMLLVRANDGSILNSSIYALQAGRLLRADALDDAEPACMPLDQASLLTDVITHEDVVSLGAATYGPYGSLF